MNAPIFLIGIVSLTIYLNYKLRKANKNYGKPYSDFIEREREANSTRRKDIPENMFFTPDLSVIFSFETGDSEELVNLRRKLELCASKKMMRLDKNMSNTDLKLNFGLTNLDFIIGYEENFDNYARALFNYAQKLHTLGFASAAEAALLSLIEMGTEESRVFLLLADIYAEAGSTAALEDLYEKAQNMQNSSVKYKIMHKINERCNDLFDQ